MVEVQGREEKGLRKKIKDLTWELDNLEARQKELSETFGQAVRILAGLLKGSLPKAQAKALKRVVKVMSSEPVDVALLKREIDRLKKAIISTPTKADPIVKKPDPETGAPGDRSAAGRHVAIALLEGLRMGDPDFDARLDLDIQRISRFITNNEVRPAMSVLVDILDMFREVQEERRRRAEAALKEILGEVLKTETGLVEMVDSSRLELAKAGREHDARISRAVGNLAQAISKADELDLLKSTALEHLRQMREGIKARQAKEQELLSQTRRQLEEARRHLNSMRRRMQEVEAESEKLSREALTDPLTKVWNKRAFTRQLQFALTHPNAWPFCLIMVDIDNFKGVNDTYGHQAGDRALVAIADRVRGSLRKQDTLFRYAGDEFVILLLQTPKDEALQVAERVRQATANIRFTFRGQGELRITISMGVTQAEEGDTVESLFQRADQALYQSKQAGRDRVSAA